MELKQKKVTIVDIAKDCGVSTATVSRVLANAGNVKESTCQLVEASMKKLNYRNIHGFSKGEQYHFIAIIVDNPGDSCCIETITEIVDLLQKKNYLSLICFSSQDIYKYLSVSQRVSGFLTFSMLGDNAIILENAKEEGIPLVAIHRCPRFSSVHSIVTDDYFNAYLAYKHLFSLGHRHITLINHGKGLAGTYEATLGYNAALEEFVQNEAQSYIYYHNLEPTFAADVLRQIQACNPEVTALICANEAVAWAINDCLFEDGLNVPEDMSLVSFNIPNLPRSRKLTSVGASYEKIAEIAVETILRFIENPASIQTDNQVTSMTILKSDLSVGFSTAAPKRIKCKLVAGKAKQT